MGSLAVFPHIISSPLFPSNLPFLPYLLMHIIHTTLCCTARQAILQNFTSCSELSHPSLLRFLQAMASAEGLEQELKRKTADLHSCGNLDGVCCCKQIEWF